MEKRDLYDINRNLTGETIFKGEPVPDNRYIIVVLVFIQNSKGEFLIQKRSEIKDGKYASTGGHAKTGETSMQAIQTEIKDELGLDIPENELELIYSGRSDEHHTFFDIYFLKKDFDLKDLRLQKEEVEFCEWDSISRVKQLIRDGEFLDNHSEEVFRMIDTLKQRGIEVE